MPKITLTTGAMELAVVLFLSCCTSLPHQLLMHIEKTPRASLPQLPQALLLHQMLESLHHLWGLLRSCSSVLFVLGSPEGDTASPVGSDQWWTEGSEDLNKASKPAPHSNTLKVIYRENIVFLKMESKDFTSTVIFYFLSSTLPSLLVGGRTSIGLVTTLGKLRTTGFTSSSQLCFK